MRLYDGAQATAYINGRPLPALPDQGPHPEDLLTDKETAALLGVDASTVRAYATTGYLPAGTERHGRTWWPRHVAEARLKAGDQRHHNPGRQPGDPRNRAPRPRPRHDPRITEIVELNNRAPLTTTDIDADTQVPVVVALPLTDALLGCLRVVLSARRDLF